jgi:hypothetical protein
VVLRLISRSSVLLVPVRQSPLHLGRTYPTLDSELNIEPLVDRAASEAAPQQAREVALELHSFDRFAGLPVGSGVVTEEDFGIGQA